MIVCAAMALQAESVESRPAPEAAARLVEAARSLMWEAGGTGFTVDQVVAAAGSSLKSFYRCFSSKDELLVALFADDARRGAEALDAMVARRPPAERLRTAVVGLFRFLSVDGQLPYAAALVGEHLRLAQARPDELAAVRRPFLDVFEREVSEAAKRGEIRAGEAGRDARTMFHLVLSHLHALVWHQIEEDPKELSEQLWAFCAAALSPTARR
jgi:AcrR family transcriptional regulator